MNFQKRSVKKSRILQCMTRPVSGSTALICPSDQKPQRGHYTSASVKINYPRASQTLHPGTAGAAGTILHVGIPQHLRSPSGCVRQLRSVFRQQADGIFPCRPSRLPEPISCTISSVPRCCLGLHLNRSSLRPGEDTGRLIPDDVAR